MGTPASPRALALAGTLAFLVALTGCGGGSSSSASGGGAAAGGSTTTAGMVNLAITDAPSDTWQQVSVQLVSAGLIAQGATTATPVWTASAATPTVVNLVDLSSVAALLGTVSVPAGTYTTLQLTFDTAPSTMTLVDANGNTISSANIKVQGSGTVNVTLMPALVVSSAGTATVQADFDLSDPLSITETTLNGAEYVTLDLQVKPKPLPAALHNLQFTRKLGQVTAATSGGFTLTDASGLTFTYEVDGNTLYRDADTKAAGTLGGLTMSEYVLVDANLNADGTLYARRVWYAATAAALPANTPEGLVQSVDPVGDTFTVLVPPAAAASGGGASTPATASTAWAPRTVTVNASTAWTFATSVSMGTGTGLLADLWRGCRVDVQLDGTGQVATAVNVEAAFDEGFISSATPTSLTFGIPGAAPPIPSGSAAPTATSAAPLGATNLAPRSYPYYANAADPTNAFVWWYFGLPSATDSSAADLVAVVTAGQTAQLPVSGFARLYWDTVSGAWQVAQLILEPEPLSRTVITTAYQDGGSGSGTLAVTALDPLNDFDATTATPFSITLDYTGDLQTVVSATDFDGATQVVTVEVPVPEAQWATLLVPPGTATTSNVNLWVRPVLSGSAIVWHAYSVASFTGTLPPQPTITSFTASATTSTAGAPVVLTPVFANGNGVIDVSASSDSVTNPGRLPAVSGTPVTVKPEVTTTYTLCVGGAQANPVSQSITITVGAATPAITRFTANPATIPAGAPVSLTGVFTGGQGVITPGNLPATSKLPVPLSPSPAATTTYTLTVTSETGATATQTATVTVAAAPAAPAITSFTASPATITAGATATLTPVFTGGTGVITPGHLPATASNGAVTVHPAATTTYTLTVTNPAGKEVTQTVTVTVTPAASATS